MLAQVQSAALVGIDALPVSVEADVAFGLPVFAMAGLPDASVRESRDRVRAAIRNSGFDFPATRLTVNHSPEPFSNILLSIAEDLFVPVGVWIALEHPVASLTLVSIFLIVFAWISPKVFRALRLPLVAVWTWIAKPGHSPAAASSRPPGSIVDLDVAAALQVIAGHAAPLPAPYAKATAAGLLLPGAWKLVGEYPRP